MKKFTIATFSLLSIFLFSNDVKAENLLDHYQQLAQNEDPAFGRFSAERGQAFFLKQHATGKPETPACTTCHTKDATKPGQTRAGKTIAPLALSVSPERYSDLRKTEKWFRRNCNSVLGRSCTALEKGDFITFMTTQ